MESRRTISKVGGNLRGQSKYHPHFSKCIGSQDFMIPSVNMHSSLLISKKLAKN